MQFLKFLRCLVVLLHCIFDWIVNFLFGLYFYGKSQKLPPITNDLLFESASSLARKIRTKEVSSEEVVKAFVERSKEIQKFINAVVEDRYEEAIEEAKEVDRFLEKSVDTEELEKTKPFLGVPFTTKESHEVKGLLCTMGLRCRRNERSTENATAFGRMKAAGAILIAKTNIPEYNLWVETRNNLYGQTNNPYDTVRTVGGSSGGEASSVAACGTAISLASDLGGSTRIPAFCNGVFGFKPSEGVTPLKGVLLRKKDHYDTMFEVGPICKKSEDLIPFLKVIAGEKASMLKLDEVVDLKDIHVFYQKKSHDLLTSNISCEMKRVMKKARNHLKGVVASTTKIRIPGTENSYRLWRYWMTQEDMDVESEITNGKYRANGTSEVLKKLNGESELTLHSLLLLLDRQILPKEDEKWARDTTSKMKKFLIEKLGQNGVLLYPSAPEPATYHYVPFFKPFNFGYFCLFNVLRLPTCQVPLGLNKNGLPVGIQVVAAPYNDHLCIAVARELEKAFGGWIPPS